MTVAVLLKIAASLTTAFIAQDFFQDGLKEGFSVRVAALITGAIGLFIIGAIWL